MRYAMTGATGFVGGALARQLREAGHEVVALVRDPARATALTELGVELRPGDLDSTAALDALTTGVDGLFHVAGWYRLGERDGSVGDRVNVEGTRNVLLAALRNRVRRVVYTSTVAVNSDTQEQVVDETYRFTGTHLSNYDRTKAEAHDIALDLAREGLPVVIVQPGLVYGPGDTAQTGQLIAQVVRGGRPLVPAAGGVCWAHVEDVARGHVLAMERGEPGRSYMLTGPHLRLVDGLKQVAAIAGTKGPRVLPERAVRATARALGAAEKVVPLPPGYAAETMRASLATYYGTSLKAQSELGWTPRPLDQGLRETVDALRRG
ncbi:NAD-dependent epimerase/dehydratase family protein [Nocardioides iriomotensis]|uniref:NAD-dependent epimerase/dehydratase family protein n=1 Tax=Nocardioides iriomotensis TaxID=715784 RepID=A0A4Q5J2X3_9ACTN|nr:NAD-dependent epimerase/dehydratase family protein [Nocardioides iriomotensis]RYU12794.1 NAD-dependent epimerase/dehydratase family protein [Nocardioides iriomotensis]